MPAPREDTPILQLSDFKSIQLMCTLVNTTTQTPFRETPATRLIQFVGDRGLMFEAPDRCCSAGHSLMIRLTLDTPDLKHLEFKATARVDQCVFHSESVDQVQVTLLQFDEDEWARLLGIFRSRQSEIEDFLSAAKGS